MIMPENLNKNLEQKRYTECVTRENYYSAFPTHPSPLDPGPYPPLPKKIRFGFFVKIHLLETLTIGFVLKSY